MNKNWKFYKGRLDNGFTAYIDDSRWESISIPHTWNNIDGQDGTAGGGKDIKVTDYFRSDCWYRKKIFIDKADSKKQIFLRFQGANTQTELFVNEKSAGIHKGGYTAFAFDITPYIQFGADNLIAVKVNNEYTEEIAPLTADFTFYGGIYREIELIKKEKIHFSFGDYATRGIKISTPLVTDEKAECCVSAVIENNTSETKRLRITAKIEKNKNFIENPFIKTTDFDKGNNQEEFAEQQSLEIEVAAGEKQNLLYTFEISNPHLWNGRTDPFLYKASFEMTENEMVLDCVSDTFGLRYFSVDREKGFFLNGKSYNLRGVSRHQDRKDLGNALTANEHNEDFALIYDMGVNSIRLAHYPQAEYFYRLCDC